jgi:hypothetical protein
MKEFTTSQKKSTTKFCSIFFFFQSFFSFRYFIYQFIFCSTSHGLMPFLRINSTSYPCAKLRTNNSSTVPDDLIQVSHGHLLTLTQRIQLFFRDYIAVILVVAHFYCLCHFNNHSARYLQHLVSFYEL